MLVCWDNAILLWSYHFHTYISHTFTCSCMRKSVEKGSKTLFIFLVINFLIVLCIEWQTFLSRLFCFSLELTEERLRESFLRNLFLPFRFSVNIRQSWSISKDIISPSVLWKLFLRIFNELYGQMYMSWIQFSKSLQLSFKFNWNQFD